MSDPQPPAAWSRWPEQVLVLGLDGLGLRVVEQLSAVGVRVTVVQESPDPRARRLLAQWGVRAVEEDPRDEASVLRAGLSRAGAVVCVGADDLQALETALLARRLAPDARVVVQIRNPAVGRALAGSPGVSVVDVATVTAPSIVQACLDTQAHLLHLAEESFVVAQTSAPARGTVRELYGDLAPFAVGRPSPGAGIELCPGRDVLLERGDQVCLVGTEEQVRAIGITSGDLRTARLSESVSGGSRSRVHRGAASGSPQARVQNRVRSLVAATDARLRWALLGLFALTLSSIGILLVGYREPGGRRMSVLDAVYFTVETVATIGYGDYSFRQQPTWLRVFAVGLMLVGAGLATTFFALLTNLLVSRRLADALGQSRVTGLSGHVVVVGLGSIGVRVVAGLQALGRSVVVVDRDDENRYATAVRASGVSVVTGDATLPGTLERANVRGAGTVAVLTSDDLTNLEVALTVRDQAGSAGASGRRQRVVLRLFDRRLASTVGSGLGLPHVRSTDELAAPWFVGPAVGLEVLGTFYALGSPLLLARLVIRPGGGLDGLALGELAARSRVLAVRRPSSPVLEHPPRRGTRLGGGDEVFVVGDQADLLPLVRRNAG